MKSCRVVRCCSGSVRSRTMIGSDRQDVVVTLKTIKHQQCIVQFTRKLSTVIARPRQCRVHWRPPAASEPPLNYSTSLSPLTVCLTRNKSYWVWEATDYEQLLNKKQAVARIIDRAASQHLWGSRGVIGHVTLVPYMTFPMVVLWNG